MRHKKTASEKKDCHREDAAGREALQCHDGTDALQRPQEGEANTVACERKLPSKPERWMHETLLGFKT